MIDLRGINRNRAFGIVQRTVGPLLAISEYDADFGRRLHLFITHWLSLWRSAEVRRGFVDDLRGTAAELLRDWVQLDDGRPAFDYTKREVVNAAAILDELADTE